MSLHLNVYNDVGASDTGHLVCYTMYVQFCKWYFSMQFDLQGIAAKNNTAAQNIYIYFILLECKITIKVFSIIIFIQDIIIVCILSLTTNWDVFILYVFACLILKGPKITESIWVNTRF